MFDYKINKQAIYAIIAIMVFKTIYQYSTVDGAIFNLILSIPGVLIAITFHEFAHAFVAYKLGDDTAKREGRLSLNPFSHLDPMGTVLLLFAGFGWGKPVKVNARNYTRKMSVEKAQALVSIAGPIMNFFLAIVFTIIICVTLNATGARIILFNNIPVILAEDQTMQIILELLLSTIMINVGLGVFNLIPLPPLDGSKVILPFLPMKAKRFFVNNEMIFYMVFAVIWLTGVAGMIITPIIQFIDTGILQLGLSIFGINI